MAQPEQTAPAVAPVEATRADESPKNSAPSSRQTLTDQSIEDRWRASNSGRRPYDLVPVTAPNLQSVQSNNPGESIKQLEAESKKGSQPNSGSRPSDVSAERQLANNVATGEAIFAGMRAVPNLVTLAEFASKAKALHPKLDLNSDEFLSEIELTEALQSNIYKGQDRQVVAALVNNRGTLETLSNDEFCSEDDGVTVLDLDKFAEAKELYTSDTDSALCAKNWLEKGTNFTVLDDDKDGWISSSELRNATITPGSTPIITYLRENLDDIEEASNDETGDENDGITKADIKHFSPIPNITRNERLALLGVRAATMFELLYQRERVIEQIDPALLQKIQMLKPAEQ